ncbi:DUF3265 domain-containing protein [Vibrio mimicus]|nr:DUF3265 domain-containing protein [Vibrio mimicus]TXX99593.1 DUF3265 domain-containing protein [Vibrio mimicus]
MQYCVHFVGIIGSGDTRSIKYRPNKQFKRDSARVAFLVCVGFCVEVACSGLGIACFTP